MAAARNTACMFTGFYPDLARAGASAEVDIDYSHEIPQNAGSPTPSESYLFPGSAFVCPIWLCGYIFPDTNMGAIESHLQSQSATFWPWIELCCFVLTSGDRDLDESVLPLSMIRIELEKPFSIGTTCQRLRWGDNHRDENSTKAHQLPDHE